jgi:subtilisin family serine protease
LLLLSGTALSSQDALAAGHPIAAPEGMEARLESGYPQDLIIRFDDRAIENESATLRRVRGIRHDDAEVLSHKKQRYHGVKQLVTAGFTGQELEKINEYDHLPLSFVRLSTPQSLRKLLTDPRIMAVYENRPIYPQLTQSLPLIHQPVMAAMGFQGSGTTVAVIDTGIDFTKNDFGSCTAPGLPSTCRIAASIDATGRKYVNVTTANDLLGHGTNVAGIVAGTAPATRIAAIKVFLADGTASDATVINGIDWAIANQMAYNIVALNLSLGDGTKYKAPCDNGVYATAISQARAVGIIPVAAAGNEHYIDGLSSPACTPGVVSVGAVYDSNVGGLIWGTAPNSCTDNTTSADKVTCFSNSASFLTMLAPGAMITAAGSTKGGTSQASPHVAGAIAILRAGFPADLLDETVTRLTSRGVPITDPRNGITKPRLNLASSIDLISPAVSLTIASTAVTAGETVTVTANATDNILVSKVEFYLNGVLQTTSTAAPYTFVWDTTTVANGSYTLTAKVYDAAGNIGLSSSVTVTISQPLPVPAISPLFILISVLLAGSLLVCRSVTSTPDH